MIYGNNSHVSIASLSDDAYNRTIVINGVSKSYAMTGWRIGYAAGPVEVIKLMSSIQSHTTSNPTSIAQYAALEALNGPQDELHKMVKQFESRKDYMISRINSIDSLSCMCADGAFYIMMNVSRLYGKTIEGKTPTNSLEFSSLLLDMEKVAVIPGIAFGVEDYVRLSYATSMAKITEGLNRIDRFTSKFK